MKKVLLIWIIFFNFIFAQELITPLKVVYDYDIKKARLGKALFFEKRLSRDNSVSCATCHNLDQSGDDNKKFSIGIENKKGNINAPTVLNSRFNFVQFWNGRAKDLKEQAKDPIHNPIEMDSNFEEIIKKLSQDNFYKNSFEEIYGKIDEDSILDAIVEFEKALVTPNSRFDRYLLGEKDILSFEEKEGFRLFKSLGCISCHNGINIGGNLFQKMGVIKEYKTLSGNLGRYSIAKDPEDKYYFKVPSLRNIDLTAPYFHDAREFNLKNAIKVMVDYQVGLEVPESDLAKIEAFLKTLTGDKPPIMVN